MNNPVLIFGANTIGKLAMDIFNSNETLVYGFLDENKDLHNTEISEVIVLGDPNDDDFLNLIGQKTEAFIAEENAKSREKMVKVVQEKRKTQLVNAIHRRAYVSEGAAIGYGILIGHGVSINFGAQIGDHSIIQSGAIVDTEAKVGEYVHIGNGAIVNAQAEIGKGAFIGAGAVIMSGIKIGKDARIGAGSIVIAHVEDKQTVFGNPATVIDK